MHIVSLTLAKMVGVDYTGRKGADDKSSFGVDSRMQQ